MRHFIYSIFDTASGIYMRPFTMASDGQVLRMFKDIACDADHDIGKHPEDYSVFRIGEYDDNTGEIKPEIKTCLATALEMVAQSRKGPIDQAKLDADILKIGGSE